MIPEFLYRPGYDEKGRLFNVEASSGRKQFIQKGFREKLLCDNCEGIFGRYEKYFADLWYEEGALGDHVAEDAVTLAVEYRRFKLFLLSILWRSSVSKLEMFSTVRLGPFEEKARKMLLAGDPGTASQFQIIGSVYVWPSTRTPCHGAIMPPVRSKGPHDVTTYSFIFGGVGWFFFVANKTIAKFSAGALSTSGSMVLPVNDLNDHSFFNQILDEHLRNAKQLAR